MKLRLFSLLIGFTNLLFAQSFVEAPQVPSFPGVTSSSIAFADVDNDNDMDLLITGNSSEIGRISKLYSNDGLGNFSEIPDTPFDNVSYSSIAFTDVDGDDDQDVFILGQKTLHDQIAKLYTNDGLGNFSEVLGTPFIGAHWGSTTFADVDGDNDQDLLLTGISFTTGRLAKLYINDGIENFSEMVDTPFVGVHENSVGFADIDGDNDLDLLIIGIAQEGIISKLYINDGMGNFSEMTDTPFEDDSRGSIAFADVDGDNDQDLLIAGTVSKLYLNDGLGNFSEMTDTPFDNVSFSSIAFADVDGDNDQDVLITGRTSEGEISKLYTNDGLGNFSELVPPFEGVVFGSIAFADVDGDNDQDVLITGTTSSGSQISKLYINNGMTSSTIELPVSESIDLIPYPNPIKSNSLKISIDLQESGLHHIEIYSVNGQLLSSQREFIPMGQHTVFIDVTSLTSGTYFIHIGNEKRRGKAKFIIE